MLTPAEQEKILYAARHLVSGTDSLESGTPDAHASDSVDLAWEIFEEMLASRREIDRDFGGPRVLNAANEWVPAIPMPKLEGFLRRPVCEHFSTTRPRCGRKFWTPQEYEAHYALDHIVRGR